MAKYVKVTEQTGRRIMEMLGRTGSIGGRGVNSSVAGTTIHATAVTKPINRRQPSPFKLLKVISITSPVALGAGKYWCRVQKRKQNTTFAANSTHMVISDFWEDLNSDLVFLINTLDSSGSDVRLLNTGGTSGFTWAFSSGETIDANSTTYPVYYALGPGVNLAC